MDSKDGAQKAQASPLTLLKSWDFSALFFGGFVSNIGSYFTVVAIVFLALNFTKGLPKNLATQEVALISTLSVIPMIFLGPLGGAVADRLDRKKILYLSDLLGAFAAFSLFFSTQIWHLYVFSIVNASVRQFFYPAKQASLPKIVKRELLLSANGFIQSTQQLSRIIGPLIAGFITAAFGLKIAFLINGATYVFSSTLIMTIRTDLRPIKDDNKVTVRKVAGDLKEGFSLVISDNILSFILVVFFFTILAIGFLDPLIVPYLNLEFGLGEKDFGILMSFSAISGTISAIILSAKRQMKHKILFMLSAIVILGGLTLIIGIAPYLPGKIVWLFVGFSAIGIVNVGFNIPFSTLLQKIVHNKDLGKISGIIDTVLNIASLIASLTAVLLAKYLKISIIFIIISGVILGAGIISLILNKHKDYDSIANIRERKMGKFLKTKAEAHQDRLTDNKIESEIIVEPTL